jgi:zinc and cadmium transporter
MNSLVLLTYYCLLILLASIAGGMIPVWFRLTHRWMEFAVSFVAGVMLGIGLLHMLPHALEQATASLPPRQAYQQVVLWVLVGLLVMFFVERFFCFHHHEVEDGEIACSHDHSHDGHQHQHGHELSWSGAALGLTLHSVIEGIALAAAVAHEQSELRLAGLGTLLVILLHKPFDSMTIATLMAHGGWSLTWRHVVNGLFALAIPLGVLIFHFGLMSEGAGGAALFKALAFAAGTFLCIALSDLLPELQFHHHDRGKLSAALLLGLTVAWGIVQLEGATHRHPPAPSVTLESQ